MSSQNYDPDQNPFEERADDIDIGDLGQWNVQHQFFDRIQSELLGPGAKLFVGPRGCGKTHQIRLAHSQCKSDQKRPFAVYVTFARYFWLEPRLGETSDARQVFQGWVIAKILESAAHEIGEGRFQTLNSAPLSLDQFASFINAAEKGLETASYISLLKRPTRRTSSRRASIRCASVPRTDGESGTREGRRVSYTQGASSRG